MPFFTRFASQAALVLPFLVGSIALDAISSRAAAPAVDFDLQGLIDRELAAGKRQVVVPPGRYRVTPKKCQHLALQGLRDVQILADGVEMVCTETTRALTVHQCTDVLVRGLTIDYDPLPFTQGRITALSADKRVHDIELFAGYPPADEARTFKYEIFAPDTRTLRCEDHGPKAIEVVDARHFKLTVDGGGAADAVQVGDLIVIGAEHAPGGSVAHAVECSNNKDVTLEGITLYASNCFGFLEYECDGSVYRHCVIDRRAANEDPVPRADARLRSLNADAYHSKHALRGPQYLGCTARFMGDDCVNICGDYHMVVAAEGKRLRVLAKHTMNIAPRDPVELVRYDGQRLDDAVAVSVTPAGEINEDQRAFLARQRMDAGLKAARGALTKAFWVELDRQVDLPLGSVIASAARMGNGFAVKDCTFGYNRSRGILIKASHGEVSGNRIEGSWMSGILVAPEYWWLESGSSSDLLISGNTITNCRGVAICIEAFAGDGSIAPAGAHKNITICGNTIRKSPAPGILVTSTAKLKIEANKLELEGTARHTSVPLNKTGLKAWQPVVEVECSK